VFWLCGVFSGLQEVGVGSLGAALQSGNKTCTLHSALSAWGRTCGSKHHDIQVSLHHSLEVSANNNREEVSDRVWAFDGSRRKEKPAAPHRPPRSTKTQMSTHMRLNQALHLNYVAMACASYQVVEITSKTGSRSHRSVD